MAKSKPQLHGAFEYFVVGNIGEDTFDVSKEYALSILTEDVGITNTIIIEAKLFDQANWNTLGTITSEDKIDVNVSTYDEIRFRCTVYDPVILPRLIFSAFFTTPVEGSTLKIQADAGDTSFDAPIVNPIVFKSSDSSVSITGSESEGSINFTVAPSASSGRAVERFVLSALDITNKYVLALAAPATKDNTRMDIVGGGPQSYGNDFIVTTDDGGTRVSWDGLALDGELVENEEIIIEYK